jgi:hypothetical protein
VPADKCGFALNNICDRTVESRGSNIKWKIGLPSSDPRYGHDRGLGFLFFFA